MRRAVIMMLVFALLGGAMAIAETDKKAGGKKEEAKKTHLDSLLGELKALSAKEKAKPEYDKDLVRRIDSLVKSFARKNAKKAKSEVKLEDLSKEDREKLEKEVRDQVTKEWRERREGGGNEYSQGMVDRAKEGVKIKESEEEKVDEILGDLMSEGMTALRAGDFELVKDMKNDAEKRLRRTIGSTRAKKIMNNVNKMMSNRWGGRGR